MEAGERRRLPRGRVAHIITSDETQLWVGEGMSLCGRWLMLDSDKVVADAHPVCATCTKLEKT